MTRFSDSLAGKLRLRIVGGGIITLTLLEPMPAIRGAIVPAPLSSSKLQPSGYGEAGGGAPTTNRGAVESLSC